MEKAIAAKNMDLIYGFRVRIETLQMSPFGGSTGVTLPSGGSALAS
jgi:hypothetical protein